MSIDVALLGSQKEWLYSPETERMLMGGFRAGKTRIGCTAGFMLSHHVPGNLGFIGRASGKDLQTTTIQTFFDEVCPPEYIVGKPKKIGQSGTLATIRCDQRKFPGATSQIYFDYIIDKQSQKSHLAGGNWGWFLVDQVEEVQRADWLKLQGRLSRTRPGPNGKRIPIKTHALGVGNQIGHNWIFEDFYEGGDYIFDLLGQPRTFWKAVRVALPKLVGETVQKSRLGIIVRSEENAMSHGGFVPDEYYANLRRTSPPSWVARYLDGSFDDFSGKIYTDYNINSVHNIEPFPIPDHWPWYCCIDPGGSVPWGIGTWRVDEQGNKILIDSAEEIYRRLRLNPNEAVKYVKDHLPIEKTRFIMDYQNIPVMQLFHGEGIYCEPAMKDVKVGLDGSMAQFYVNPAAQLPSWYKDTQPKARYEKFAGKGSPQVFAFNTCKSWAREHDNFIWDPVKRNVPKEGQQDHHADQTKYFLAANPKGAEPLFVDPYHAFRKTDPVSAQHLDRVSRELERHRRKQQQYTDELEDPFGGVGSDDVVMIGDFC